MGISDSFHHSAVVRRDRLAEVITRFSQAQIGYGFRNGQKTPEDVRKQLISRTDGNINFDIPRR